MELIVMSAAALLAALLVSRAVGTAAIQWAVTEAYSGTKYEDKTEEVLKDLDQLKRIGPAAFEAQMEQKLAILAELLEDYNEGRRKSFYCRAVTLLPLAELETVMTKIGRASCRERV